MKCMISLASAVQDFVSYCRLVKCAKESAGSGMHLWHEDRQCVSQVAFSEAAVLFLRNNPAGQKYLAA